MVHIHIVEAINSINSRYLYSNVVLLLEYSREAEEEEEGKKRAREADSSHLRSTSLLLHFSFSLLVIHSPSRVTLSHY